MSAFYYHQPSLFSAFSDSVPPIAECIDQLANLIEQQNPRSIRLSSPRRLNTACPPRLTFDQLNRATQDYPYQLPLEVQILYQRCNGCFPVGIDSRKDWDSFDNYCDFNFPHTLRHPLLSQCLSSSDKPYWEYLQHEWLDSRFFPIASTGDGDFVVVGSVYQRVASPILFIELDGDDQSGSVWWKSLTDMFLAEIERMQEDMSVRR